MGKKKIKTNNGKSAKKGSRNFAIKASASSGGSNSKNRRKPNKKVSSTSKLLGGVIITKGINRRNVGCGGGRNTSVSINNKGTNNNIELVLNGNIQGGRRFIQPQNKKQPQQNQQENRLSSRLTPTLGVATTAVSPRTSSSSSSRQEQIEFQRQMQSLAERQWASNQKQDQAKQRKKRKQQQQSSKSVDNEKSSARSSKSTKHVEAVRNGHSTTTSGLPGGKDGGGGSDGNGSFFNFQPASFSLTKSAQQILNETVDQFNMGMKGVGQEIQNSTPIIGNRSRTFHNAIPPPQQQLTSLQMALSSEPSGYIPLPTIQNSNNSNSNMEEDEIEDEQDSDYESTSLSRRGNSKRKKSRNAYFRNCH